MPPRVSSLFVVEPLDVKLDPGFVPSDRSSEPRLFTRREQHLTVSGHSETSRWTRLAI